jgi:hypothetical protein
MRLSFGELDDDRQAVGIDQGVDLGGQAAARTPHAFGASVVANLGWRRVRTRFLTLPPC